MLGVCGVAVEELDERRDQAGRSGGVGTEGG